MGVLYSLYLQPNCATVINYVTDNNLLHLLDLIFSHNIYRMVSMSVSDHLDLSDLEKREAMANLIEFELCDF